MTPLWLDLLKTPMAAPETRLLRRMRLVWRTLCLALAVVVSAFRPLHLALGRAAPLLAGALLIATSLLGAIYFACKHRADSAHLDRLIGGEA